jgi:hypothetical protein
MPPLATVAIAGLLLVHTPPVFGDKVVVAPIQIELLPVMFTTGLAFTFMSAVGTAVQPKLLVTVTEYVDIGKVGYTLTLEVVALDALALHK